MESEMESEVESEMESEMGDQFSGWVRTTCFGRRAVQYGSPVSRMGCWFLLAVVLVG